MARFVPDINTKRWVIIAPKRAGRPDQSKYRSDKPSEISQKDGYNFNPSCPFCYGNENQTPPEIYRWGINYPTDKKWLVRVVPNKYPITDIHEVIIHSPDHVLDVDQMPIEHVTVLLKVYKERYKALSQKGTVIIFNNRGPKSGESLVHPHSQVVVIPQQITLDSLTLEPSNNIVHENSTFITFCPDFSQWPYEVWITKKECCQEGHNLPAGRQGNGCVFGDITDDQITALATALQETLQKLCKKFPDLSYNFYIYPHSCWYLRIIPRLADRAGFELGTGLSVNVTDPADAARELINHSGS